MIAGIDHCIDLQTLNLDYNRLSGISGLENCTRLKRLFLNKNNIQMVSGLHNCYELTELYLNDQNFQDSAQGIGMLFDRDSMIGVSDS
jgi:Leucine-rich repeat (LRR) protein